jgi:beta-glucanase (GH16 family)
LLPKYFLLILPETKTENLNMKKITFLFLISIVSIQVYPQKWVQVWGDEFNSPGLPDTTKWTYEVGKLRNAELQYYTVNREENARIQDTVLIIEARKEAYKGADYTSASLISKYKGDWLYGKFEISAKVPGGKGTWPAIWMMPTDAEYGGWPRSGEIDIMEYVGMNPSNLYFTTHYEGTNGTGHQSSGYSISTSQPYNKFMKFAVEWSPDYIKWFADDKLYFTYTKKSDDPKVWPFNKMFYMILNLAYGGSWGGQQGVDDTKLPHQFMIDYVRVYQLQEKEGPFSLNVSPVSGGSVQISPLQTEYADGSVVTLEATPDPGYEFSTWLHLSAANPTQLEVNRDIAIIPVFQKKNEIVINGTFDKSLASWSSWFDEPSAPVFTTSVADSVFVANITKQGTANWHIVEQQIGVPLVQGESYTVSFDAWADVSKTMDVFLSRNFGDYSAYYSTTKSITTTPQTFTWKVKMLQPTDPGCRFGFGFGQFTGNVYLDNVSIVRESSTQVSTLSKMSDDSFAVFPNPTSGILEIESHYSGNGLVAIHLLNLRGQHISTIWSENQLPLGHRFRINMRDYNLEKGIYFLNFSTSENQYTKKIVIN